MHQTGCLPASPLEGYCSTQQIACTDDQHRQAVKICRPASALAVRRACCPQTLCSQHRAPQQRTLLPSATLPSRWL